MSQTVKTFTYGGDLATMGDGVRLLINTVVDLLPPAGGPPPAFISAAAATGEATLAGDTITIVCADDAPVTGARLQIKIGQMTATVTLSGGARLELTGDVRPSRLWCGLVAAAKPAAVLQVSIGINHRERQFEARFGFTDGVLTHTATVPSPTITQVDG